MPFNRFPGVDTILGPEMRSTGEVMGWDRTFARAFLKAQIGAGVKLPESGRVFVSVKDSDKNPLTLEAARIMAELGFEIVSTSGTLAFLAENDIAATRVNKVYEGRPHIVDMIMDGGTSSWCSTPPRARNRSPTAARSAPSPCRAASPTTPPPPARAPARSGGLALCRYKRTDLAESLSGTIKRAAHPLEAPPDGQAPARRRRGSEII